MTSSSSANGSRRLQYPLLNCPACDVLLIQIVSKQEHSKDVAFIKCPNNVKGDPTTCGWIRSEEQYEAWFMKQKEKHIQFQLPLHSPVGDPNDDLKQQFKEMKHTLDRVVTELGKLKVQIGDRDAIVPSPAVDLGHRKMQIVLDVSVVVGVLVGVLLGVVVSQMMK